MAHPDSRQAAAESPAQPATNEAIYRAIFDAADDAIFALDWSTGAIVDVNARACDACGFGREALVGMTMDDLGARPARDGAVDWAQRFEEARVDRCAPFEWRRRNRDGSLRWDEVHLKPVTSDGTRYLLAFVRDITERWQALSALRAQEEQYRAIFDGSVDAMVLWNNDLRVVDVNRAFVALTGLSREQVVGRHWTERGDAGDMQRLLGLIESALQGREAQSVERVSRMDGTGFDIELRYLPVRLGDAPHALGVGRDVGERLERERALERSEAQYRGIFNASADALVLRDAEFRIVDVNATYEAMSGYTREEVLGLDRVLANPMEIGSKIRALHRRALAGEAVTLRTHLVRRDGGRYELELRGVPVLHRGEPHVLYMGRDITEAWRAEQALRASEEQYRAIFNASADGLVLRDAGYQAVDVNPAYLAMTGYARDEVIAARRVLSQRDDGVQFNHWEQHAGILAGRPARFEVEGTRKDGARFDAEVHGMPVRYRGQPHVLYAVRDITERRRAEEQRVALERQLRQAQKMEAIGQLTGGIAHDFNNILTSVIGYLVLGQERAVALGDATLQRQLGQAHLAAQRARDLIAQMLAFARRQRGQPRTLSLVPLVQQSLELLRATLPASVALDFQPGGGLHGDASWWVTADPVQLEQVLFNLCINARDAIHGPGTIQVQIDGKAGGGTCASCRGQVEAGDWVALVVRDDGCGIADDLRERMFEPFTSSKEVGRGSGMGLAMVHGIVHEHGGHVVVESRLGEGSVFRVLLPRSAGLGEEPEDPLATPHSRRAALKGRVMVVEDERLVGDYMAELLGSWGLDVVLLRDPRQALDWLARTGQPLDLLITDQTMPHMTGLALAQRALQMRPPLPVVLYTGNAEGIDSERARQQGVRAVLQKPVDVQLLQGLVRDCLGARPDTWPPGR